MVGSRIVFHSNVFCHLALRAGFAELLRVKTLETL